MRLRRRVETPPEVVRGIARVDRRTKDLAKRIGRGRDRDHRPPRHRPRRGRVARRRGSRRGRERERVDLRALSERRPDPYRARPDPAARRGRRRRHGRRSATAISSSCATARSGATASRSRRGRCSKATRSNARMEEARQNIGVELRGFAQNTLEYVEKEAELTFEPLVLPNLKVDIQGRHALVVVRGHDYRHDLKTLHPYIARVPARDDRGRRRRRRAARGRVQARHHHR